jgi:NAD(P)-dependent dehydrogenase (short-subunit alcohol dehydrogenase family)
MDELRGKVAVVTGAASGIGYALAERFVAEGMKVVLADINDDGVEAAAGQLEERGAEVLAVPVDVSQRQQVQELELRAVQRFGAVHVLCNNAGVLVPGRAWSFSPEEWDWLLGVNLGGVVNGISVFVPGMLERGEPGHVVNTSSAAGLVPHAGLAMYTSSKFAVIGLSETLAHDLREERAPIGVSVLCPGATTSSLNENSAALQPGDREIPYIEGPERKPAADVAGMVVDAIRSNRFWILTRPGYNPVIRRRAEAIVTSGELVDAPIV